MKTLLTLITVFGVFQGLSAYQPYNPSAWADNYMEKLNRDMDRAQNRMYQEDMIRLQREANQINSSLQNQRGYRYGYGR
jgi:hypothetical protein